MESCIRGVTLSQLDINLSDEAVIDRILQSLPPIYKSFVLNYNMQGMVKNYSRGIFNAEISGG